ncbi:hypothetical protein [Streptomyces sp. NPDC005077]|uniref:hypothetical protein n=1 Tax=Streptomyces sp. NPDC005077 TaxID=3154292 RepID=UPI0033AB1FE3
MRQLGRGWELAALQRIEVLMQAFVAVAEQLAFGRPAMWPNIAGSPIRPQGRPEVDSASERFELWQASGVRRESGGRRRPMIAVRATVRCAIPLDHLAATALSPAADRSRWFAAPMSATDINRAAG